MVGCESWLVAIVFDMRQGDPISDNPGYRMGCSNVCRCSVGSDLAPAVRTLEISIGRGASSFFVRGEDCFGLTDTVLLTEFKIAINWFNLNDPD